MKASCFTVLIPLKTMSAFADLEENDKDMYEHLHLCTQETIAADLGTNL